MINYVLRIVALTLFVLSPAAAQAEVECVALLHGLTRTSTSMIRMEIKLEQAGFKVVNSNYASRDQSVQNLASNVVKDAINACEVFSPDKIHFVTHSLGGILVRFYFLDKQHDKLGRVVMLGPPNQGSELVDVLDNIPGFSFLNGPSGSQLGTRNGSMSRFLRAVNFELGIIAGNQSINPLYSMMIPGPDDGKVSVESTRLDGNSQHIVMPVTHTWMMFNTNVIEQAIHFLNTGGFMLVP
ncbi:MAG: alpha/beta hydrolase [Gammaproteobacteria bacterium]|jgi:triacylglycerol esterase/lipase EstA (alpha/beta hydrolase family)|nr:acetyltransferase [Gammaproteobacteria bacterium]MDP6097543.1 alpha/beta hydrolase [Gammaproteobacteria bacterium]HJO11067.1 alpha/beta hydrolase [Gammaproteobacteria bacterium]|tara:strand:- start:1918 stop:2637 length:720 start_codon:yes stop_codon:yes gene_type:complete